MLGTLRRDSLINKVSSVFQNDNVNDGEEFFICFGKSIGYSFWLVEEVGHGYILIQVKFPKNGESEFRGTNSGR